MTGSEKTVDIPEALTVPIGEVIKRWREFRGWTVTEFAEKVQLTKGYISQLEHNRIKQSSDQHLAKLASALEIEMWDIINRRVPEDKDSKQRRRRRGSLASPPVESKMTSLAPTTVGQKVDALLATEKISKEERELISGIIIQQLEQLLQLTKLKDRK